MLAALKNNELAVCVGLQETALLFPCRERSSARFLNG